MNDIFPGFKKSHKIELVFSHKKVQKNSHAKSSFSYPVAKKICYESFHLKAFFETNYQNLAG